MIIMLDGEWVDYSRTQSMDGTFGFFSFSFLLSPFFVIDRSDKRDGNAVIGWSLLCCGGNVGDVSLSVCNLLLLLLWGNAMMRCSANDNFFLNSFFLSNLYSNWWGTDKSTWKEKIIIDPHTHTSANTQHSWERIWEGRIKEGRDGWWWKKEGRRK